MPNTRQRSVLVRCGRRVVGNFLEFCAAWHQLTPSCRNQLVGLPRRDIQGPCSRFYVEVTIRYFFILTEEQIEDPPPKAHPLGNGPYDAERVEVG